MAKLPPPRPSPESPNGSAPRAAPAAKAPPPKPKGPPKGTKPLSAAEAKAYAAALRKGSGTQG